MLNPLGLSKYNLKKINSYRKKTYLAHIIVLPITFYLLYSMITLYIEQRSLETFFLSLGIYGGPFMAYLMLINDYRKRIKILLGKYKYKNEGERIYYEEEDKS